MQHTNPYQAAKDIEATIIRLTADTLEMDQRLAADIRTVRREMTDARLDIRDYELAETRAEQMQLARACRKRLAAVRTHISALGTQRVLGGVDVAHLSARLEQLDAALV